MSDDEARMTFIEHLGELRGHIIRSAIALMITTALSFAFYNHIYAAIVHPLQVDMIGYFQELMKQREEAAPTEEQAPAIGETAPTSALEPTDPLVLRIESLETAIVELRQEVARRHGEGEELPGKKKEVRWVTLGFLEPFLVKLKLSFVAGIVLAFPYILWEICRFIFPGLKPKERHAANFLIFGGSILGLMGVSIAYFGILPLVLPYLMQLAPGNVDTDLQLSKAITDLTRFYLGFALAFQFPMIIFILTYLGILDPNVLKGYRRVSIVVICILSAFFTPPEPISMIMMAVPLIILYEISIWGSLLMLRYKKKNEAALG